MPPLNRRAFLASAAAMPLALRSIAQKKTPRWVLLGTGKDAGILRCSWDSASGKLGAPETAIKTVVPSFLAVHPKLPRLYSVNEEKGDAGGVSSFHLDVASGGLEFLEHQSSMGDGPCFISVDKTGQSLFAANYSSGSFAALPLSADGRLKPATGSLNCRENPLCGSHGPFVPNQKASHIHSAVISPGNDFVLACDLGNDNVEVFPIHPGAEKLLGSPRRFDMRAGSGPRHLEFHPNGRWVYVVHELDCTIDLFDWTVQAHAPNLTFRQGSVVSTLAPGGKLDDNSGCEIVISPDGRFVYTCTRGIDVLIVYRVDPHTGALTEQQRLSCGGKTPRHFAFDPSHRWLLCANQDGSPTMTVFANDTRTGKLSGPTQTLAADMPMFVQFI